MRRVYLKKWLRISFMRMIQQLSYDGKKLFCPDHPTEQLEEAKGKNGSFVVLCTAAVGPEQNCMNSAEWPTKDAMLRELTNVA
jgi:hypothetical protein